MIGKRIIVDEDEPETDVDEPTFNSSEVQILQDRWICDDFQVLDFLGRGKYGEVKRCTHLTSGVEFAAKFICTPRPQDKKDVEHEVEMMRRLRHRRLVQLHDAYESRSQMCIVLEIVNGGELFDRVISDEFQLTEKACACILRQICEGVEYMHSRNTIHLDLKPENIMCLSKTGNRVKIIDFGLARIFDPKKDTRVLFGTPEFMAPEVILFDPIHFATDMWSIGVMCYVLLSGLSPFMGSNDTATLSNVTTGKFDFNSTQFQNVSEQAKDFIRKLLILDKLKRMTATMCLDHLWLRKTSGTDAETSMTKNVDLSKEQMKAFVYRRKWQKAFNVIVAVKRMRPTVTTVQSSNLVDPRQESHHRTEPPDRSHRDACNHRVPDTLLKTRRQTPSSSDLPKKNLMTKVELRTLESKTKVSSVLTPSADIVGTKVKPPSAINGFDSNRMVDPQHRATSSKAPQAKTSKDKDVPPTGNRSNALFKQTNKTNMSNFMKLRNVFSGNRS